MQLNRLEVLRGLRISTWEAIWATVWIVLTTGAFQTGFALYLGASPFWLGVLAGLPAVVGLLQLPASVYVERRGERRRFVGFCAAAGRLLWLPILAVPFTLPRAAWLPSFVVLLALSSTLLTITVPAWTSWMSDLVPADHRGRYFGRRNMLAGVCAMLVPLPAGAFLDQAVKYGRFDPKIGFAVLFGLASVAALASFALILRQPEPTMARDAGRGNVLASLTAPLGDRNFRGFLVFAGFLVAGQTLAAQFFTAWQLERTALDLPYLTVQVLGAVASLAGLAATPVWGFLADKYGSRPLLWLACCGVIIAPLLWVLTVPKPGALAFNIGTIVVINLFSGAFWGGVGLAQFNLLLGMSAPAARGTYVAVFSAVTGLVGGVSPILGGALMGLFEPFHAMVGPIEINNYKILFLVTAAIRFSCLFLLAGVRDAEGHGVRYVLGQLRPGARPVTSWWTLRRLTGLSSEAARREAVTTLGDLASPLAVEELVTALDDVSLSVREGAAHALGEIGDPRAVPALVAKLGDPAAGIGAAAAESLGRIGDPEAVPALLDVASGPDATVRLAALRALGRLRASRAVPVLLDALDPGHPATSEAVCDALVGVAPSVRPTDAKRIAHLMGILLQPAMPRGLRLSAARVLEAIAPKLTPDDPAYDQAAAHVAVETDAAVAAQVALALSRLPTRRSPREQAHLLVPILDVAAPLPLAYKQALAALARIADPENDAFYPYLGLPEMARDEAMAKLLRNAPDALEAYTSGDYVACLRALQTTTTNGSLGAVLSALGERKSARAEEALLGAVLRN